MTDSYNVVYSVDALGDLREIYSYIANELLVPKTAAAAGAHTKGSSFIGFYASSLYVS